MLTAIAQSYYVVDQIAAGHLKLKRSKSVTKVRLGLIGMGRLGSIHAKNIATSENTELYAVCDTYEPTLEQARSAYQTKTFSDIDEFLTEPLDGVVIASNTHLHIEHIRAAAKAGKHIFTEKPIGLTLEETDEVLQDVVNAGVLFQIGFQRRWDPRFLKAKAAIKAGEIGEPILFKAYARDPNASNPANWGLDKNGGLYLNCAIHDYDAARFIFSKEVTRLSATGAALVYSGLKEYNDIDTCTSTLFLGENAMAMTEWSKYAAYGYDVAAEIVGTEGIIQIGHEQTAPVMIRHRDDNGMTVFQEFADAYAAEIEGFAEAVRDGKATTPGIEDARIGLQLALLARSSFEADGKMINVEPLKPLTKQL